jgi:hypothetical protein
MNMRMKTNIMKWMCLLAAPVALIACNTEVEHDVPAVDAPVLVYIHAKKLRRLLRLRSLDTKKNYIAMKTVTLNRLEPHT